MPLETWVSIGALITVGAAVVGTLLSAINRLDSRLSGRIDSVETRLTAEIRRVDERVEKLDDRVYALAAGLKPLVDRAQSEA